MVNDVSSEKFISYFSTKVRLYNQSPNPVNNFCIWGENSAAPALNFHPKYKSYSPFTNFAFPIGIPLALKAIKA